MIDVYVKGLSIDIGRQGENLARNIYFDLSELINTYGEGTATLVHMRPLDKAPYVCAVTRSDTFLIWAPTSTDTAYAGAGKCELRWVVGDVLAKSIVYRTSVTESITGDSTVPSEYESWYEALLEHISEYEIASDQIAANTSQITANTSDIAVLDGRMDEFTKLPDGSTAGDAELTDIRVGADGTVYNNAGDAVRTQIADLKYGVKKTNDELFADGNIPKVGPTFNNYGIGTDGIRYYDSNKQIVRYNISNAKFLHITLKTADDTCVFQSNTSLPDTGTPNVYIVGTPFKGICDRVVEIPDSAVCVFITQAKTLTDDVVYTASNIDALNSIKSAVANIGENVDISFYPYWEKGGLDISNNAIVTSNYNKNYRARTSIDHPIHLSKGDRIKTESGFSFYCFYMDGDVASSSGYTTTWYAPKDIDAYITIKPTVESGDEIPLDTLVNSISFMFADAELTKIQNTLYNVLTSTSRSATSIESPDHRACWADYLFSAGNYVVRLSGTLDTSATTRVLLMKAHTLSASDIIKTIYTGVVSDGSTFFFDVTTEEASEITCVAVSHYTAESINYTVELFDVNQYYWQIEKLSVDVSDLKKEMIEHLPDYYYTDNWLGSKIAEIHDSSAFLNGVTFSFITDLHFTSNAKNSKLLLKEVLDKTSCSMVISGGDYASMYGTAEQLNSEYQELLDYAGFLGHNNWFSMLGNHDFYNAVSSSDPTRHSYTWGKTYNGIFRSSERWQIKSVTDGGYFCIDNDAQKTRMIILNSCEPINATSDYIIIGAARVKNTQLQWLFDRITELSNYKIIVFSHIPSDPDMTSYSSDMAPVQTILEAFASKTSFTIDGNVTGDFYGTTNELICHISGHSHRDESHLSNGVLSISTTCDAHYSDDGHGAVVGTVTEQAFDVFCFDYDAETITAVRVGRGATRKWSFDGSIIN